MAGRSVPWRKDPSIMARLVQVEDLHLMGISNYQIAMTLKVDEKTIRNDLARIALLWHERASDAIEAKKNRAASVYRRIQRAAWLGFQAVKDTSLNKTAYLNTIKSAEDSIVKIYGLEAPTKVQLGDDEHPFTITLKLSTDGSIPVRPPTALPAPRSRVLRPGALLRDGSDDEGGEDGRRNGVAG